MQQSDPNIKSDDNSVFDKDVEKMINEGIDNDPLLKKIEGEFFNRRNYNESLIDTIKNNIEFSSIIFPLFAKNKLDHLDILLDTAKSFLVISVTVITTFSVLDPSKNVYNINLNAIEYVLPVAIIFLIISIILIIYILYKRKIESDLINKHLSKLEDNHYENELIRSKIITNTNMDNFKKNLKKDLKDLIDNKYKNKNI